MRVPDHPRSRGVYTSAAWAQDLDAGSSPLARGLPLDAARGLPHSGIIPARAGFTAGHPHGDETTPDHPRSRGVYADDNSAFGNLAGSSPLARGLRGAHSLQESVGRIIPARAGFTSPRRRGSGRSPDHPRSRGVYVAGEMLSGVDDGSSPLARGLPAGPTTCSPGRVDHPRSRGVYPARPRMRRRTHGSSPLARGLLPGHDPLRPGPRIIPARAGFTAVPRDHRRHRRDHPRSRGVYSQPASRDRAAGGSSPLARGLRETLTEALTRARIIPARAGFTGGISAHVHPAADHPRSRGVYPEQVSYGGLAEGSSPLARGLR